MWIFDHIWRIMIQLINAWSEYCVLLYQFCHGIRYVMNLLNGAGEIGYLG